MGPGRTTLVSVMAVFAAASVVVGVGSDPQPVEAATTVGPLHTNGVDGVIYDAADQPVRLVGFNWTGTEQGGRNDFAKTADVCGTTWRTPADPLGGQAFNYDSMYQNLAAWGYNTIRLPVSWHNLEPVAPTWNAQAGAYVHSWNPTYLNDLRSIVTKARAAGLLVILDIHQDYWSPALHDITNWNGTSGYCEGVGLPRWMYPSIDAKASTTQNTDFYNGMNWFFRNVHDPQATVTNATPWQLLGDVWELLSYEFSPASGFTAADAVVGADIFNEPYWSYVGGEPLPGMSVLQTAGVRLQNFYAALAPSITGNRPSWLLFFQDGTGGYNAANPAVRETPVMTGRPNAPGNWVYSLHNYNFGYGTFSDGVTRHDDFGITVANAGLANARAWGVPLYMGEFTNYTLGIDSRLLTDADMAQTKLFLDWAEGHGVSWTFWAYVNGYRPMTLMNYTTNQPIPVVQNALATGLDGALGPNRQPVASFTSSAAQLVASFNGSGASDPDGSVVGWSWQFGDGTAATGATANHTYAANGTYTVTLTVTDNRGGRATRTGQVTLAGLDGVPLASDTFTRTVTGGFGTADLGGAWTLSGGATNFSVNGSAGRMSAAAGGSRTAALDAVRQTAVEVRTALSFDKPQTGGGTYISVIGRRINATNDYRLKLRAQSTGAVTAQLVRTVNGAETVVQNIASVPGLTWTQGEVLRVRLRVNGTAPTSLSARVWEEGATEPATWQLQATDTTAALQAPGGVGVWTYVSSSATQTPMIVSVDDLVVAPLTGSPPPANVLPTASFTTSCTNLSCSLDGSGSSDPDGSIVGYAWAFGDGQTGAGATALRTYAAAGTYTVTLTVTDDRGGTGSTTRSVTVITGPVPTLLASDDFGRTSFGGWGSADLGGAWTVANGAANLAVNGGTGAMTTVAGAGPSVFLNGVSSTRTDVTDAGAHRQAGHRRGPLRVARWAACRRVRRLPGQGSPARDRSGVDPARRASATGVETALGTATTVPGLTYDAAVGVRIRVQVTGANPTTVRARVWSASAAEPTTWAVTASDATPALQAAGGVGVVAYLSSSATNAPIVARFDELRVAPVP